MALISVLSFCSINIVAIKQLYNCPFAVQMVTTVPAVEGKSFQKQQSTVPYLATDKVNDKRMNTKEHLEKKSGLFLWVVTKDKDKKCVNIRLFCYKAAYLLTKLVSSAPT